MSRFLMTTFYDHNQQPHEKPEGVPVIWRMSAYGILENEKGEWLMVEPSWVKKWDLPGGGIEPHESIIEGLTREFYEETGYRIAVDPHPVFVSETNFYEISPDDYCHAVMFYYRIKLLSEERDAHVVNTFEDGYEIADMRWVNPDTMNKENVQFPVWKYLEFIRGL